MPEEAPVDKQNAKVTETLPVEAPHEGVKLEVEKDVITEIPEEEAVIEKAKTDSWEPKTSIGKKVKSGEITTLDQVLDKGQVVLEPQITEALLSNLQTELLLIGQSKGKFGGGQRRIFKQTQKKTPEGNKPSFACMAAIGNENGYVGVGYGKSKDTVPAREKAIRQAKINVFKIRRGCGSWQCGCKTPHSIPFKVNGKCGSVEIVLMPAPKGKGLIVEPECAKVLKLAGIKDAWSKTYGQTRIKNNLVNACIDALKKLMCVKTTPEMAEQVGLIEGKITQSEAV